jgi:hypothetical protein
MFLAVLACVVRACAGVCFCSARGSYNVLAPSLVEVAHYPSVPLHLLDWDRHRMRLVVEELAFFDADVVCLQVRACACRVPTGGPSTWT